jgi:hypothetical protein
MATVHYNNPPVEDRGNFLLPLAEGKKFGIYDGVIVQTEMGKTKAQDPMLKVKVKVYGPDFETTIFDNVLLTNPKTAWRLKDFLESVGLDYNDGQFDTDEIIQCSTTVKIVHEEYNGEVRNKISTYIPRVDSTDGASDGEDRRDAQGEALASAEDGMSF